MKHEIHILTCKAQIAVTIHCFSDRQKYELSEDSACMNTGTIPYSQPVCYLQSSIACKMMVVLKIACKMMVVLKIPCKMTVVLKMHKHSTWLASYLHLFIPSPQDTLEMCSRESEFKSILFSLVYFHAVVIERRKFGPQGWNRSYPYNTGDLTISVNVLYNYLEANAKVDRQAMQCTWRSTQMLHLWLLLQLLAQTVSLFYWQCAFTPGSLDWPALPVWPNHVWRTHYRWLGS